ncbi:MAG: hypothetical protein HKP61_10270 [Dactylosporangium sp.]|nr:hypothetical protein [Dactylosporangium sp.]NNJ61316.1 hypothetical protein [Dactylosporangium sp.]
MVVVRNFSIQFVQGPPFAAHHPARVQTSVDATCPRAVGRDVQHPDRDAQFHYLNAQISEHRNAGEPAISVDAK